MTAAVADESFNEGVYREAVQHGYTPEIARLIADGCSDAKPQAVAPVLRMCRLYGAEHLAADLVRAGVSVSQARVLLTAATGTARVVSAAGIDRIRLQLMARKGAAS